MRLRRGDLIILLSVLITICLYLLSKPSLGVLTVNPWLTVSQILALTGTTLLAFSFVLGSRFKFLENWFGGLDKVNNTHQTIGKSAFLTLLQHPLFLAINALPNYRVAVNFLFFSQFREYNFGVIALYVMMAVLFLTLVVKLPYHKWLVVHDFMGLALLFGSLHIFFIDSDVSWNLPLRWWIFLMLTVAAYFYVYKVFLYKLFGEKYRYLVKEIRKVGDILEIYLEPKSKPINFLPGQFAYLSFDQKGLEEDHPFSFSSSPDKKTLRFSVKMLGDYTSKLKTLKRGATVNIWGAHGRMYERFYGKKDVVCIAGGIGITPFLSMLDYEKNNKMKRKIDFFYSAGSKEEAVYDRELKKLDNDLSHLRYYPYFGKEKPRLTAEIMEKNIGKLKGKIFYICGPMTMMTGLADQLYKKGVAKNNVIFENFNFK